MTETNREFLERHWDNVATRVDEYGRWMFFTCNDLYRAVFAETEKELFDLGVKFTRDRLEEIRQIKEEMTWLDNKIKRSHSCYIEVPSRILARLQRELEQMQRGMRKVDDQTNHGGIRTCPNCLQAQHHCNCGE